MYKSITIIAIAVFYLFAEENSDSVKVVSDSAVSLVNVTLGSQKDKVSTTVLCTFNFIDDKPVYFFEVNQSEKKISIQFVNAKLDGFFNGDSTITISSGPLKDVLIHQELKNKNADVVGLRAEWYYVITATFSCDPIVKSESALILGETRSTITLKLEWPDDQKKREEIYLYTQPKSHKKVWILSGIGAGVLGAGGVALWYFNRDHDDGTLKTVLPMHP